MFRFNRLFIYLLVFSIPQIAVAQTASFVAPDTVCVNEPINIQNTSTGVTNYLWNFCSGTVYSTPEMVNLGDPGNNFTDPVFSTIAKEGNNYYVFVVNNTHPDLVRLNFGNSLLNTPTSTRLPNLVPPSGEGIQIVQDATGWHAIIVGGTVAQGSRIVRVDFGASLANNAPTVTNWGNIGGMAYPTDLFIFQEGGRYYGFTNNFENSTITRLDFGTDFSNPPTGVNMTSFGGLLNRPSGIFAVQENGNWYIMVTNEGSNKLVRLNFGPSLLNNAPTTTDLGNPGGVFNHPRDISIVKECGQTMAVVVNGILGGPSSINRLNFAGGVAGTASGTNLGNPGGTLSFPASISSVFRVGNELYAFVPNVDNGGSLARMAFKSCTDASIPNATTSTPPSYHYTSPGHYTVNLITDEGTAFQQTFCKNIVVLNPPTVALGTDIIVCNGATVNLTAGGGFSRYSWSTGANTQQISVTTTGLYDVTVDNGGCTATDQIQVTFNNIMTINPVATDIDCTHPTGTATIGVSGGTAPYQYTMDNGTEISSNVFTGLAQGNHFISVRDAAGCVTTQTFAVNVDNTKIIRFTASGQNPTCFGVSDGTISALVTQGIPPFEFALAGPAPIFQTLPDFTGLAAGTYKVYARNGVCLDSQMVTLLTPVQLVAIVATLDEICSRGDGSARITLTGGTAPYDITWSNGVTASTVITDLSAGDYSVSVADANNCPADVDFSIANNQADRVNIINGDTTINIGDEIILRAENAPDYAWEPIDGFLSCLTCAVTTARPVRDTRYIVRTLTGLNCITSDTVNVRLTYNRSFQMPTAFSPNNDGANDLFRPRAQGLIVFHMVIYNRWGQLLHQTTDHRKGWDGKMNGKTLDIGTYVYVVNYGFWDDTGKITMEKKQGTFTLIK
ncbi:T9SS type B sorting domain-containing protein [Chitinophaga sp. SYP-B3965]|uniref:T9SS type B sorting domain-containing protein n=1 Tax=Chitinophaga sp. SYP-B3965 TaxID=2663120 RepID=UPI00129A0764|nr:T9SS type B sorting domain-containing protein [Chitinophaga sp. SYP-B3965]MRG44891.1 T9SS type B sorting domain-containing protein [Chitinophaga sp. SYP-B3965]